jgi:hypothetical protein
MKPEKKESIKKSFSITINSVKRRLRSEGAGKKHTKEGRKEWNEKSIEVIASILDEIEHSETPALIAFQILCELHLKEPWAENFKGKESSLENIMLGNKQPASNADNDLFDQEILEKFTPLGKDELAIFLENHHHLPHFLEIVKLGIGSQDSYNSIELKEKLFDKWTKYAKGFAALSRNYSYGSSKEDLLRTLVSSLSKKTLVPDTTTIELSLWISDLFKENYSEVVKIRKILADYQTEIESLIVEKNQMDTELEFTNKENERLLEKQQDLETEQKRLKDFIEDNNLQWKRKLKVMKQQITKHTVDEISPMLRNLKELNEEPSRVQKTIFRQINQIEKKLNSLEEWSPL